MAAGRIHIVHWCLFSCAFQQVYSVRIIDCTGSLYSLYYDQTIYGISEMSRISDLKASDCTYSWTGDQVLAHHEENNPEQVVRDSINDLITSECFDRVTFTRSCISEGEGYTAYCTTNCTLNALKRSQKHKEIATVVIVVFLVLLCLGAGVLCYRFKDRASRTFSCRPPKWFYTSVKMQNIDPNAADLMAGNA